MAWQTTLRRIFGLGERANAAPAVQEQISVAAMGTSALTQEDWYWGPLPRGTEEDALWRRLSDNWFQRDTDPATFLEILNHCYEAYTANPLAFTIVETITNFTLGRGVLVSAANKRVQRVLEAFWRDADNHMDTRIYSLCTELSVYGEQFVRFFVNPIDGRVKVAQIDPSTIDEIVSDPENVEKPLRFHQRPVGPTPAGWQPALQAPAPAGWPAPVGKTGGTPPALTGTEAGATSLSEMEGRWFEAGSEVVQFCINKVSNARRGRSDLATLLPWLRRYKDWLTDRVRLNKYKTAFLWDVTLQGADAKTVDRKRMEYAIPLEPGTIVIHNESERCAAVKPEINASDVEADGRALRLMLAAGAGIPEHYLADGGNANRATAAEMNLPTLLKFERRQQVMEQVLRAILDRVIVEAKRAGTLAAGMDESYTITFPELKVADHLVLAQATSMMVNALATAKEQRWVSDETAMRLLFQFAGEEVDLHAEREKVRAM